MFCPNCGKQLKENAKFCGACGIKIQERGFVSKDEKKFKRVTVSSGDAAQTSLPSLQQGEKTGQSPNHAAPEKSSGFPLPR